jgi:hypothetical protein
MLSTSRMAGKGLWGSGLAGYELLYEEVHMGKTKAPVQYSVKN